jgi:hypothetical protein
MWFLLSISFRRGDEMRIGRECRIGNGRSAAEDLRTAEFWAARSDKRGKFCRHQVAAERKIRIIPYVDEMRSTRKLR